MTTVYSKDPQVDRTLHHSVRDAVAYSVMSGGGETYFSAFALFLKASASQVGLLATLPALLGSLAQLLAVWLGARLPRRLPVILAGASLQAVVLLPLVILPLSWPHHAVPVLIGCVTPLWISLMGDLVPERKRGRYFGSRTRLATITAFVSLAVAGLILDRFDAAGWTVFGFLSIFLWHRRLPGESRSISFSACTNQCRPTAARQRPRNASPGETAAPVARLALHPVPGSHAGRRSGRSTFLLGIHAARSAVHLPAVHGQHRYGGAGAVSHAEHLGTHQRRLR
jgi:MFS family permease